MRHAEELALLGHDLRRASTPSTLAHCGSAIDMQPRGWTKRPPSRQPAWLGRFVCPGSHRDCNKSVLLGEDLRAGVWLDGSILADGGGRHTGGLGLRQYGCGGAASFVQRRPGADLGVWPVVWRVHGGAIPYR